VSACAAILIVITYWLERRAILGGGRKGRVLRPAAAERTGENYVGWQIPLISPALSAIVEKELRYLSRNAQLRMMTLMPLILIAVRFINRRQFDQSAREGGGNFVTDFFKYGQGLLTTAGILYVFLILAGLFCNQFAFDGAGMRTLILSPIDRKKILVGKNLAISTVALIFCAGLLAINQLVFRDMTSGALLFATLSFLTFAALMSVMGNWFSVRFPKRMKFGKRLNVSGVVGLLLIPMIFILALPPLAAVAAGYVAQSLLIEYVTLAGLAALSLGSYLLIIRAQVESLQQREVEILEAINDPGSE
jgi:hypothetical protein